MEPANRSIQTASFQFRDGRVHRLSAMVSDAIAMLHMANWYFLQKTIQTIQRI